MPRRVETFLLTFLNMPFLKIKQMSQFSFTWVAITAGLMMMMMDLYIRPLKLKSAFPIDPKADKCLFNF